MTNNIIVYRNPMEKALWETLMSSDVIVYLFILFIGLIIGGLCHTLMMAYVPRNKRYNVRNFVQITSAMMCVGVWTYMFHQIGLF